MEYWGDIFSDITCDGFRGAGARVNGVSHRLRKLAQRIKPGDIFLCYMAGAMRWAGALEASG